MGPQLVVLYFWLAGWLGGAPPPSTTVHRQLSRSEMARVGLA